MIPLPDGRRASLLSESARDLPTALGDIDDTDRANEVLRRLRAGEALLWTGDWRNGRHLLKALRRRLDRRRNPPGTKSLKDKWREQRADVRAKGALLGGIFVLIEVDGSVNLRRAPDTTEAVELAWGLADTLRIVALNTLVGALSAAEWTRKGMEVEGLVGRLTPRFGVFSPTRSAYVELLAHLDVRGKTVLDVGCGTGVLAFVLLQNGASTAIGTDLDPRAITCATDNAASLALDDRYTAVRADLFPADTRVDCMVFNAPWVPETPRTRLDHAVFDEDGQLLQRFLRGIDAHLTPDGCAALLISDLPERLGLREQGELEAQIRDAGLTVVHHADTGASHRRSRDTSDPLHEARAAERVGIWVLKRAEEAA
ncbi:MAG: 50S ribosomal protein L11 methyltransferase [Proteobacteria bacterium]|nr:50S ribosomal protein L11 methyltransferase [Pseudomonadota bacterium]